MCVLACSLRTPTQGNSFSKICLSLSGSHFGGHRISLPDTKQMRFAATIRNNMPSAERLDYDHILNYLRDTPAPVRLWEIANALGVSRARHRELKKSLSHLKRRKLIQEVPGGRFSLVTGKH